MKILDKLINLNKVKPASTVNDNLKIVTRKIISEINSKDKYSSKPKDINMSFDEFISFSENMEHLSKYLNFKFVDFKDVLPENLEIKIPESKTLIENNIYILEENKKKYLLIHDIRKLKIHETIKEEIPYDEIALASKHTISILLGLKDEINASIDETRGADDYMNEIINIAKVKKATEIYISLRSYALVVRIRNFQGVTQISTKGIKEAELIRKWLEIKADARDGAIFYDGMIRVQQDNYRINFQDTANGYRVTMRVYQQDFKNLNSLSEAGYTKKAESVIKEISLSQDGGMLFVAPTGQGKTTTQNALMSQLSEDGNEIISVENPVEKFLSKTDQVDMSKYTNAEGIHKVTKRIFISNAMRSKADIIGIGELRDREDYEDAKTVALTGHFFMGSTHTTSVKGTFERLKDNGWSELDIKSLIRGVVYQQLTRALCDDCKTTDEDVHNKESVLKLESDIVRYKANYNGCSKCFHGYKKTFTPIAEVARFPIFNDFNLYDTSEYLDYISFIEDAKAKFDDGIIDYIHYHALEKRVRMPFLSDFIDKEILESSIEKDA